MAARGSIEGQAPLVLVIDDNEDNLDLYAQFLAHKGWRVATAPDGVQGLEQAASHRPDVIVLDLGLPKLDGWEVARRLKGDPNTKAIPVLAVTAHALGGSKQRPRVTQALTGQLNLPSRSTCAGFSSSLSWTSPPT